MIYSKIRLPLIILILIISLLTAAAVSVAVDDFFRPVSSHNISKIGGYTTYFADSSVARKHNIHLAAESLDGVVVAVGDSISFNAVVGAREESRGYMPALIISHGEYVEGIGGGVCQVSTTLYNAWITSGLAVTEVHAHSLVSHYVPLSRDAMVSSASDLVLQNTSTAPVLINCVRTESSLSIRLFGAPSEFDYQVISVKNKEIISDTPVITYLYQPDKAGTQEITYSGAMGYESHALIRKTKNNQFLEERVLRRDRYSPTPMRITIYINVPPPVAIIGA